MFNCQCKGLLIERSEIQFLLWSEKNVYFFSFLGLSLFSESQFNGLSLYILTWFTTDEWSVKGGKTKNCFGTKLRADFFINFKGGLWKLGLEAVLKTHSKIIVPQEKRDLWQCGVSNIKKIFWKKRRLGNNKFLILGL